MAGCRIVLLALATAFAVLDAACARDMLTSVRTYYVRTDGNDANDCLSNTAGGACLTIQGAIDKIYTIDLGNYGALIQVGAGTYAAGATLWAPFVGGNPLNGPTGFGGVVTIRGDVTAPSNVLVSVTNGGCVRASYGAIVNTEGIKCVVSGSGSGLYASAFGQVWISDAMEFGSIAGDHMLANAHGFIACAHNYLLSGSGSSHYRIANGGSLECNGVTVFVSGSPSFSLAFAWASGPGVLAAQGNSYSGGGSITGKQYDGSTNAVIYGNFPGTISGTVTSGARKQ